MVYQFKPECPPKTGLCFVGPRHRVGRHARVGALTDFGIHRNRVNRNEIAVAPNGRDLQSVPFASLALLGLFILLRYLQGLEPGEIGELLGVKINAVQVRLNRARARLKEHLGDLLEEKS